MSLVQSLVRPMASSIAMAIQAKSGGGTVTPPPAPTTVGFTGAQMLAGFTGGVSTTKNAARIYVKAQMTVWSGYISGTEAKLTTTSEFGDFDGAIQVAIDGGAFTNAPRNVQVFTLFTGLPHAKRFVEFRYAPGLGEAAYIAATGAVLSVTGQPPALQVLTNKIEPGADSALGLYGGAITPNSATFTPPLVVPKGEVYGSAVNSVKIKGAFTQLVVTLNGTRKVGVSKNGAQPVFYSVADEANTPTRAMVIPCDGSTSTYNVWDDGNFMSGGGAFCVTADSAFLDIGTRRRLDQYGDSVTFGSGPGATSSDTETMWVAAQLGFVGSTNGISGQTVGGGKAMIDACLALRTVSANDVAILALGGNNAQGGIDSTEQADYGLCIDKLLAKGYSKVLCRGILPQSNPDSNPLVIAANATLKAVMVAKNNPKLVWIDPVTWVGYTTVDGVHPDSPGYITLGGYAAPAYASALGL